MKNFIKTASILFGALLLGSCIGNNPDENPTKELELSKETIITNTGTVEIYTVVDNQEADSNKEKNLTTTPEFDTNTGATNETNTTNKLPELTMEEKKTLFPDMYK